MAGRQTTRAPPVGAQLRCAIDRPAKPGSYKGERCAIDRPAEPSSYKGKRSAIHRPAEPGSYNATHGRAAWSEAALRD